MTLIYLLIESNGQCNGHLASEEESDPVPDEIKPFSLRRVKSKGFSPEVSAVVISYSCIEISSSIIIYTLSIAQKHYNSDHAMLHDVNTICCCSNSSICVYIVSRVHNELLIVCDDAVVSLFSTSQQYGPGSCATLPTNLYRAASTSQVPNAYSSHYHTLGPRPKPTSTSDLSMLSPNGPSFMPAASRRQRRASLVSGRHFLIILINVHHSSRILDLVNFSHILNWKNLEKYVSQQSILLSLLFLLQGTYATVYKGKSRYKCIWLKFGLTKMFIISYSITGSFVALKEIRLEHEEGAPCTAIREGLHLVVCHGRGHICKTNH